MPNRQDAFMTKNILVLALVFSIFIGIVGPIKVKADTILPILPNNILINGVGEDYVSDTTNVSKKDAPPTDPRTHAERLADFYINTYVLPLHPNNVQAIYSVMHNNSTSMEDAIRAISGLVSNDRFDQLTIRLHRIEAVHDGIGKMESIQITSADAVKILTERWGQPDQGLAKPLNHYTAMLQSKITGYKQTVS